MFRALLFLRYLSHRIGNRSETVPLHCRDPLSSAGRTWLSAAIITLPLLRVQVHQAFFLSYALRGALSFAMRKAVAWLPTRAFLCAARLWSVA